MITKKDLKAILFPYLGILLIDLCKIELLNPRSVIAFCITKIPDFSEILSVFIVTKLFGSFHRFHIFH